MTRKCQVKKLSKGKLKQTVSLVPLEDAVDHVAGSQRSLYVWLFRNTSVDKSLISSVNLVMFHNKTPNNNIMPSYISVPRFKYLSKYWGLAFYIITGYCFVSYLPICLFVCFFCRFRVLQLNRVFLGLLCSFVTNLTGFVCFLSWGFVTVIITIFTVILTIFLASDNFLILFYQFLVFTALEKLLWVTERQLLSKWLVIDLAQTVYHLVMNCYVSLWFFALKWNPWSRKAPRWPLQVSSLRLNNSFRKAQVVPRN